MRRQVVWMATGLVVTAVCLGLMAGCGDKTHLIGPGNQLEVTSVADNFQFQVTALDHVEQTLTYDWTHSGTVASVNQACSVSGGTATLVIRDGAGTEVYRKDLSDDGTFTTDAGTPGSWSIEVMLAKVSGTLNFRVQKHT